MPFWGNGTACAKAEESFCTGGNCSEPGCLSSLITLPLRLPCLRDAQKRERKKPGNCLAMNDDLTFQALKCRLFRDFANHLLGPGDGRAKAGSEQHCHTLSLLLKNGTLWATQRRP